MTIFDLVVFNSLLYKVCDALPRVEQESHRLRYPRPGPRPGARSYVLRRAGLHQSERTSQSSSDFWILDFFFEEEKYLSWGNVAGSLKTFHNFDDNRCQVNRSCHFTILFTCHLFSKRFYVWFVNLLPHPPQSVSVYPDVDVRGTSDLCF